MALTSHMLGVGKAFLLAGAMVATYFLFAVAGMRVALRSQEVSIPDLSGQPIAIASATLEVLGLLIRVEPAQRIHPSIKAGSVILQEPPPGLTTRRQRTVKVWLSAGPRPSQIPALVGQTERSAQLRIQADSLELVSIAEIRSPLYPRNTVLAQEPPPDTRSTSVSLLVNRGERTVTYVMPDLIGAGGTEAADILREQGFRVTVVGDHPYPNVPPGIILRQYPQAGFQISPGKPISLEVSR
jgi:serine/threonine-protein kinase